MSMVIGTVVTDSHVYGTVVTDFYVYCTVVADSYVYGTVVTDSYVYGTVVTDSTDTAHAYVSISVTGFLTVARVHHSTSRVLISIVR